MQQKIKQIIADTLGFNVVNNNDELIATLKADSLDVFGICMALEEEFEVCIFDDDAVRWITVQDVIGTVIELTNQLT